MLYRVTSQKAMNKRLCVITYMVINTTQCRKFKFRMVFQYKFKGKPVFFGEVDFQKRSNIIKKVCG